MLLSAELRVAIVIVIVGSRSCFTCCCCCGDPVALGGKGMSFAMLLIALLMMLKVCCWSAFRCCVIRVSRFPLPLPLSDRVPVVDVAAAMVFRLHLEGRTSW